LSSDDGDMQAALLEMNTDAMAELKNEEAEAALEILKRGEGLLE
jgi:hypothetical protein